MGERESSRWYTAVGVEEVVTLLDSAKEGFMVANKAVVVEKVRVAMGQRDSCNQATHLIQAGQSRALQMESPTMSRPRRKQS